MKRNTGLNYVIIFLPPNSARFFPTLTFDPPENIGKPKLLFFSLIESNGNIVRKRVNFNSFMTEVQPQRNQSIDFLCKSMNWFLYDRDLRHERVNGLKTILPKLLLYSGHNLRFLIATMLQLFSTRNFLFDLQLYDEKLDKKQYCSSFANYISYPHVFYIYLYHK